VGVTCAKLLAACYAHERKHVQTFADYAGERSGAPVRAYTRVDDAPITNRNKVYEHDHVIVLDDGFQHRRLARDVDLVCFDCGERPSSLELLPAGRLREPLSSLKRADGVVLTRWSASCVASHIGDIGNASGVAVIRAVSRLEGFTRLDVAGQRLGADAFRGERLGVAVGIARPERVRESLGSAREIVHFVARRDHHRPGIGDPLAVIAVHVEPRMRREPSRFRDRDRMTLADMARDRIERTTGVHDKRLQAVAHAEQSRGRHPAEQLALDRVTAP